MTTKSKEQKLARTISRVTPMKYQPAFELLRRGQFPEPGAEWSPEARNALESAREIWAGWTL